jgi:putative hydrolase of the HAD superfamily
MKTSNIRVIFSDIGGVLLTNGWGHGSRQKAAQLFGFDYDEMNALHEFIFNVYEMGKISLDTYLDTILFYQSRDFTREDLKAFMFSQSEELPELLQWMTEWKKGQGDELRIFSINNEGKELNDYRIRKFKLYRCFDGFISSCEVGMRKPDPEIFSLAMGIAHCTPDECLYIDDRLMIVEAARGAGIKSIQHKTPEETKAFLERCISTR